MKVTESSFKVAKTHIHDMVLMGALMSSILAVLAAITSMTVNHYGNMGITNQIKSFDQWNYYQAKGIKSSMAEIKMYLTPESSTKQKETLAEKIKEYKKQQETSKYFAEELQKESTKNLKRRSFFALAVSFFQIGIGLSAITVLAKKRKFLFVSFISAIIGIYFVINGLI